MEVASPLVHLATLRADAEKAECPGLVRLVDFAAKAFFDSDGQLDPSCKPNVESASVPRNESSETEDPALEAALDELEEAIEARYPRAPDEQPTPLESIFTTSVDSDFGLWLFQSIYQMAVVVPTLHPETRIRLDTYFSDMADEMENA